MYCFRGFTPGMGSAGKCGQEGCGRGPTLPRCLTVVAMCKLASLGEQSANIRGVYDAFGEGGPRPPKALGMFFSRSYFGGPEGSHWRNGCFMVRVCSTGARPTAKRQWPTYVRLLTSRQLRLRTCHSSPADRDASAAPSMAALDNIRKRMRNLDRRP